MPQACESFFVGFLQKRWKTDDVANTFSLIYISGDKCLHFQWKSSALCLTATAMLRENKEKCSREMQKLKLVSDTTDPLFHIYIYGIIQILPSWKSIEKYFRSRNLQI